MKTGKKRDVTSQNITTHLTGTGGPIYKNTSQRKCKFSSFRASFYVTECLLNLATAEINIRPLNLSAVFLIERDSVLMKTRI